MARKASASLARRVDVLRAPAAEIGEVIGTAVGAARSGQFADWARVLKLAAAKAGLDTCIWCTTLLVLAWAAAAAKEARGRCALCGAFQLARSHELQLRWGAPYVLMDEAALDWWAPGVVLELERQRKARASFRMELKHRGARQRVLHRVAPPIISIP